MSAAQDHAQEAGAHRPRSLGFRPRAATLPRETRDTLFLLLVIAAVIAPHLPHIPLWAGAAAAAALAWRAGLAWMQRPLPSRGWLIALTAGVAALTVYSQGTLLGRDAGLSLIVVMLALKTLELRARRDAMVVFFLGFFTLLTHFFYSQSLGTAAAIVLALWGLLTALVNAHLPLGRPSLKMAAAMALKLTLWGTPVMLALFVLFPRVAPLWGLPADAERARSGLSASMDVGNIAQLVLDDTLVMRVRFDGPAPAQPLLYFRGPVLSAYDGRTWRPTPVPERADAERSGSLVQPLGAPTGYEVTLEPTRQPWLFALEFPLVLPQLPGLLTRRTADQQWLAERPIQERQRYRVVSHLEHRLGPSTAQGHERIALREAVDLPPGYNPRTLELAAELLRDPAVRAAGARGAVDAALDRLRRGGYRYTLEPRPAGVHAADAFWFDTREGFCEHIASAFVVLMRGMDVPARVVTGYQGGTFNSVDGVLEVRQRDAHAWAEVWIEGEGWLRVDPTAAVAPSRIGSLQRLALPAGAVESTLLRLSPTLLQRLRDGWRALDHAWNQWVLDYTPQRQFDLLRRFGIREPDSRDLGAALAVVATVAAAATAWAGARPWRRRDPWLATLEACRRRLRRMGYAVPPQATPRALIQTLQTKAIEHPAQREAALRLCAALEALERERYAPAMPEPGAARAHARSNLRHALAQFGRPGFRP
jgi:transglutaminase-like putative cysteine protease